MKLQELLLNNEESLKILQPYYAAINIVTTILDNLNDELSLSVQHNPIHNIQSRIKKPKSIIGKLERKELPMTLEGMYQLNDIAGLRVICHYINDIDYVAQLLIMHHDVTLIHKKNYIQYPKDNGYRSLHLIIKIPVFRQDGIIDIPVEIQIRTIAMDFWASLEHQLTYKNKNEISKDTYQELKDCADNMAENDIKMLHLYQKITNESS